MNNLIRELVNQADIEVAHMECNRPRTEFEIKQQWVEKFAELIVRECVGVVEGGRFLHDQAPTAQFARECSDAIKRHFGVE